MGTKLNPAPFDCYANALPDEPMFVLLARDPEFSSLVNLWALRRNKAIEGGERPKADMRMVQEAFDCALAGAEWRDANNGKWRAPPTPESRPCDGKDGGSE